MNWRINLILGSIIYLITYIPRRLMNYVFGYELDIYSWLDKNLPLDV